MNVLPNRSKESPKELPEEVARTLQVVPVAVDSGTGILALRTLKSEERAKITALIPGVEIIEPGSEEFARFESVTDSELNRMTDIYYDAI